MEPQAVLAFGDSLTWGRDPLTGGRHPFADRWTSVLEAGLGGAARVIAEGLTGRTTCFDDPGQKIDRNGARILPVLLASHAPLALVIVMLGANDLKPSICGQASGAADGIARLIDLVQNHGPARVLLVAPPLLRRIGGPPGEAAKGRRIAESIRLATLLRECATARGCGFFDAAKAAETSARDGVHLDAANTRALGAALVAPVRRLLERDDGRGQGSSAFL